jgi:hypothetical protein
MAQHFPMLRHPRANNPGDLLGSRSSPNVRVETTNLAAETLVCLFKIAHFSLVRNLLTYVDSQIVSNIAQPD